MIIGRVNYNHSLSVSITFWAGITDPKDFWWTSKPVSLNSLLLFIYLFITGNKLMNKVLSKQPYFLPFRSYGQKSIIF